MSSGARARSPFLPLAVIILGSGLSWADEATRPARAPRFPTTDPAHWIGTPVTWESLRGHVVLLDVWTFGCINCVRTIPWIRDVVRRHADRGLLVVGVHTPEFAWERVRSSVEAEVRRRGLLFPHLLDNDHAYWNALRNEYWPSIHLVDRCGRIRARAIGEVHADEASGRELEAQIEMLLSESPEDCGGAASPGGS